MSSRSGFRIVGKRVVPSEHTVQVRLLQILAYAKRDDIYVFSIPNAGKRSAFAGQRMVAEGLRKGVADLCFMFPMGLAAWLELKTKGGSLRTEQRGFAAICARLGHRWATANTLDEALTVMRAWNVLKPNAVIL